MAPSHSFPEMQNAPNRQAGALCVFSATTTEINDNAYIHAPDPKDK